LQGIVVLSVGKVPELRPDEVFCDGWPDGRDGAVGGKRDALDPGVDVADKAHMGDKSREAVPSGKRARVNENPAQVGMSRKVFIDLGCQCLEVFRRQRRKGLDDQNAFGLQNLVLDHFWFTVMKANTASTGISGLVPNSPTLYTPRGS